MTSLAPNDKTGEDGSREKQEESIKKRAPGPGSQGPGPWDPGEVQWYCRSQCHCIEDENSIKMRRSASKMRIGSSKGSGHSLSYGPHSTFCKKTKQVHLLQKNKTSFHICLLRPNGYQILTFLCMHYWQKCRPLDSWSHERVNSKDFVFIKLRL